MNPAQNFAIGVLAGTIESKTRSLAFVLACAAGAALIAAIKGERVPS